MSRKTDATSIVDQLYANLDWAIERYGPNDQVSPSGEKVLDKMGYIREQLEALKAFTLGGLAQAADGPFTVRGRPVAGRR